MMISAALQELLGGGTVASSRLSKALMQELLGEGLVVALTSGSRVSYRSGDVQALREYLIQKDERYRVLEVESADTRHGQAAATGNSKLSAVGSFPGFFVNAFERIEAAIGRNPFVIDPPEGTMMFVSDWESFVLSDDVTVVGVENMENFRLVRRLKELFSPLGKVLFVSRYPQHRSLYAWLESIPNRYVHFGDFDLAGMHIYETEFWKRMPDRASFFVPDDIEQRIACGSSQRYDEQLRRFGDYVPSDERLMDLLRMIHRYRRCYDQEGYIANNSAEICCEEPFIRVTP